MPENRKSKIGKKRQLQQKVKIRESEEQTQTQASLNQLRKLLQEEENLHVQTNDKFLLRFLRARKFDVSRTITLIKRYYEMRENNSELFDDLCPQSLSHVLNDEIQAVLEKRDNLGRKIFLFRAGKWNPDNVNLDDIFRSNYLFLEEITSSEDTQINGVTAIVDFEGMTFYQARQFTPKHAIRMIQILQNSFPCRFQEFHMINQPFFFNVLFSIVKPFLSEKIKNRISFHGRDISSLHKKLQPEILPCFLGGTFSIEDTITKFNHSLMRKNQHYKDMCKFGYNTKVANNK